MRCIETGWRFRWGNNPERLIETWDVLKPFYCKRKTLCKDWLIETWDVLKLKYQSNSIADSFGLIETWDVLKRVLETPRAICGND